MELVYGVFQFTRKWEARWALMLKRQRSWSGACEGYNCTINVERVMLLFVWNRSMIRFG